MEKQRKKVCLITPGHIATNPRLVKEAEALHGQGYKVHIVFTQYQAYLVREDLNILDRYPEWQYDVLNWVGSTIATKTVRFTSGIVQKVSKTMSRHVPVTYFDNIVLNRSYNWQIKKAVRAKADLYIAHNLGALPVARIAAEKNGTLSGFDAEDFHRNEMMDDPADEDVVRKSRVEATYIPGLDHFTVASPLIGKEYTRLFPTLSPVSVLNTFPRTKVEVNSQLHRRLKLFWFSQTIGPSRGIEDIIIAMGKNNNDAFELHLLGKCTADIKQTITKLAQQSGIESGLINYYDPVPEKEIFAIAAGCDIGMASETGVPYNREICLTNKIFTYIQSGLAVVASDTKAQCQLLGQYDNMGKVYKKNNVGSLSDVLNFYNQNRKELLNCKRSNFLLGQQKLNWETEQTIFLGSVKKVLN